MDFLNNLWSFFVTNILTKPQFFIGLMVFVGYLLLEKPIYDALSGFVKATVGYMILSVGSGGLVSNFRPILVGLKDRFNLDAMVIDPYFGQNAVTAGLDEVFGRTFSQVMLLMLVAFIMNIILVRFKTITKMRSVFTTGHVQMQQASTAFWLILFAFPALSDTGLLIIMGLILGLYWAVGSNVTVKYTQELSEGGGFAVAHQQMFAIPFFGWLASKMRESDRKKGKASKSLDEFELPGFLSIFNENMVATSILMFVFFGAILLVLGKDYLVANEFMKEADNFFFYVLTTALNFAVYLAILQLGVRTFVTELTASFQGISHRLLPGAVPGIDCAAIFGFGSQNAVTIGFLMGALGQFTAIAALILMKSPTIVIAGFVPLFFDNAVIATFADNRGGAKAAFLFPFISGLIQVFGSALIASWVGLAQYGGYLGMFDWATVWPFFTVLMKFLGVAGVAAVVIILFAIPQLQYKSDPENYFLITDDYDQYEENMKKKKANG